MTDNGQVSIGIQDGELIFYGKVPGKVKRAIRKKYKQDKKFREDIERKYNAKALKSIS